MDDIDNFFSPERLRINWESNVGEEDNGEAVSLKDNDVFVMFDKLVDLLSTRFKGDAAEGLEVLMLTFRNMLKGYFLPSESDDMQTDRKELKANLLEYINEIEDLIDAVELMNSSSR